MSKLVNLSQCEVQLSDSYSLSNLNLTIQAGERWVIIGPNGAGKSALGFILSGAVNNGDAKCLKGVCETPINVQTVSFESQRALVEAERALDDSDITDEVFAGTSVQEILADCDTTKAAELIETFGLTEKLDRGFRKLSTGETRKVLLTRALSSATELLLLDEPFEGLDQQSCDKLNRILQQRALDPSAPTPVLVLNRKSEAPSWLTHVCLMSQGEIAYAGPIESEQHLQQLMQIQSADVSVPRTIEHHRAELDLQAPLVRLRNAKVSYGDNTVFSGLNWQVDIGQHWQVIGPNGSGKTCLLNLISGDHPQCYSNDILVVGYQRGNGETIWDIKQHLGYVSSQLQLEYRVSTNLLNVVLSGFFDSIGLYEKPSDDQIAIAHDWLTLLGLRDRWDQPFNQCSYGDQRILLIARAMVKHPWLLILDEPCLGLDEFNRQLVLTLVEKICQSGATTVLYVNHHADDKIPLIQHTLDLANDH